MQLAPGVATTWEAATLGQKLSSIGKSNAALMAGAMLAYDGLRRGGFTGMAETTAGGAMIGFKFGGPLGAAIGAAAGLVAGIVGQLVSLMISLIVAIAIAVIGAITGYYIVGGDQPWLSAAAGTALPAAGRATTAS